MFWPALYNSNAQFLSSGGCKTSEGSPLVRLGWASQLFDTSIRVSGAASMETERFVNGPGAAIDYIRTSARAQQANPENDQDYSPLLSYVPRLDFDPTFANNFATRQDLNLGIDKVFNFDGDFNRVAFRAAARLRRSGRSASRSEGSGGSEVPLLSPMRCLAAPPSHTSFPSSGTRACRCR